MAHFFTQLTCFVGRKLKSPANAGLFSFASNPLVCFPSTQPHKSVSPQSV